MENVTATFNDAAQGLEGPDGVEQGQPVNPPSDSGGGAARMPVDLDENLIEDFNRMYQPWQEPELDETASERTGDRDFSQAISDLERLEAGRATPEMNENLRPWPRTERSVHSEIERQREHQIALLKEFIASNPYTERNVRAYGREDELELSL